MSVTLDIGWLLATLLVSTRIAAAMAFAPVLGPTQIPATVRVFLALTLGALLVSVMPGLVEYIRHRRARKLKLEGFVVSTVADAERPSDKSQDSY